jgi:hypothetical protein
VFQDGTDAHQTEPGSFTRISAPFTLGGSVSLFDGSVSGRTGLGFQRVLDNLSVKSAAADIEKPGSLFFVPRRGLENALDVRALSLGQGWNAVRRIRRGNGLRVQELDVRVPDDTAGR